ncbi:MAG TPA: hypothetical protein VLL30_18315 [Reyranella sp.]|nr:hypothetical protein [Reyranella sp.]
MKRPSPAHRQDRKRVEATTAPREPLSLANFPTTPTTTVKVLAGFTGDKIATTYKKIRAGFFPSIRLGKGKYAVLTVPTLQILRGERPPGRMLPDRPDSAVKKRRRKAKRKRAAKPKPAARKGEVAPAAVAS